MIRTVCAALAVVLIASLSNAAEGTNQSILIPANAAAVKKYPQIILYSVAWCPHCRAAKEYLTKNDMPFINRDVEIDTSAMDDLTIKYHSTGVPVIVFRKENDEVIMKGFTPELFQETLQKSRLK